MYAQLTLRKIAIWLSKNCQKLDIFSKFQDGRHEIQFFFNIFASWFLESGKTKKILLECPETVEKKSGQSNNFWVSYGPLKYVYKW